MKKVTGIGGFFIKSKDPDKLKEWYKDHLGLPTNQYGATFHWLPVDDPGHKARTEWSVFKDDTTYFEPSEQPFMMNFRVDDLVALVAELKEQGANVVGDIQEYDYGKFGWVMDPDGNKIELWEPVDEVLDKFDESGGN